MNNFPDKNSPVPLPEQICTLLRERIFSGEYAPGSRLAPIRKLASGLNVAPMTVGRALDVLENENLIRRIPIKGIFVNRNINLQTRALTACFAFPEKHFDNVGNQENKSLNTEFYRGLLKGAQDENIKLQFSYFSEAPSPELLERQLKELMDFDFLICPSQQLAQLQKRAAGFMPVFRPASRPADKEIPDEMFLFDYDRQDARNKLLQLFLDSTCSSAAAVATSESDRARDFLKRAAEAGRRVPQEPWLVDGLNSALRCEQLRLLLRQKKYQFIYCDSAVAVEDVYEAAFLEGLKIGTDIMVTAVACGSYLTSMVPRLTFLQIPRFDIGVDIMHAAAMKIRYNTPVSPEKRKVQLVDGQSVVF